MGEINPTRWMLGFDIGSVAMKVAIADERGNLRDSLYRRTLGRPVEVAVRVLEEVQARHGEGFALIAGTGSAARLVCRLLEAPFINEVVAQATAVRQVCPQARTLIEMGGQDSKLVVLGEDGRERPIVDFVMNTNCAAGTGSFLDQQASRLGVRIEEEFGRLALQSTNPARVAGRCSVFAKSDMIHLQQQAAPLPDIIAGLCLGLARNLVSNLGRGMEFRRPIVFCGGVAANAGVCRALRQVLQAEGDELVVPEAHAVSGALGAVLVAMRQMRTGRVVRLQTEALRKYLDEPRSVGARLARLAVPPPQSAAALTGTNGHSVEGYLGLDVGSISTKAAVIDREGRLLAKVYLMTAGRPLEMVGKVLAQIGQQLGDRVEVRGVGTTGSGRYLTGDVVGADLVINEITAQATAAAMLDPGVDTIFEIGGQDSKYISLDNGVVVDFEMNHACAAGTGSFIEEQSERLGVDIRTQFSDMALGSDSPIRLGERCTVFMESDLLSYQQQGARTEDLAAGLCYSIVSNYVNRVVGQRRIGQRIFFQGGTAFNRGVVAAFQQVTQRPVSVPPHHEVTGAIGAAALAMRHQQRSGTTRSRFAGFEVAQMKHDVRSFTCHGCANDCEINEVKMPGREALYYGSRCDRFNRKAAGPDKPLPPDLFAERQRMLLERAGTDDPKAVRSVGLPLAMQNWQLLPLWGTLLRELGFKVELSGNSTREMVRQGVLTVTSTPCFPVKVAHGHVLELLKRQVDFLWLPSVTAMPPHRQSDQFSQPCPYVQALPYMVRAALADQVGSTQLLAPSLKLDRGWKGLAAGLLPLAGLLRVRRRRLKQAARRAWEAQERFEQACRERGRQVLEQLPPGQRAMVIVGRSYNTCDAAISLDLATKLRKLGALAIPMDFLDLQGVDAGNDGIFPRMYWKSGQQILHAALAVRDDPRLQAIYLSNFSCGPDSLLIGYFKRLLAPKPALLLEIDEHSADAGIVTRLEAFLESLASAPPVIPGPRRVLYPAGNRSLKGRTLYIPWMGDYSHGVAAAFRAHGQPAQVIPVADEQSLELGRRVCSGKECLPCAITTGDMLRITRRGDFDPQRAAFFMPGGSGPCRFGQYNCWHRQVLNEAGHEQVPVFSLSHDVEFYGQLESLGRGFVRTAWSAIAGCEALIKTRLALRPYELDQGEVDVAYQQSLDELCSAVARRSCDAALLKCMERSAERFRRVSMDRTVRRPLIGVLGEIYVRCHTFANGDLLRALEALGAQTSLASFTEWMYYTNWTRGNLAWNRRHLGAWLVNQLEHRTQQRIEHRMAGPLESVAGVLADPPVELLLHLAAPHLSESLEGEAVLSIGKLLEWHRAGYAGVIMVLPFSCMPSTVVSAVLKRLDLRGMPTLCLSYDGQQDPTLQTRLEAFVHQARAYDVPA